MESTEVDNCFTGDIMPDCPDDQNCNKFVDYLLENFVTFTPDVWACIPSEKNCWHRIVSCHFKDSFYTSHQIIFIFNELYLAVTTFNYLNYP